MTSLDHVVQRSSPRPANSCREPTRPSRHSGPPPIPPPLTCALQRPAVVPPLDLGETRRTVSDIKISVVTGRSSSSATSKSLERLTGGNRDFSNLALMQQPGMPARRRDSVPAAQSYYESSSAVQTGVGGGGASANGRLSVASSEEAGVPSMGWQPALTPPEAPGQRENRAEGAEEVRMESSEEEGGEGEGPRYIRVGSATAMRKAMRESKGLSSSLGRSHDMASLPVMPCTQALHAHELWTRALSSQSARASSFAVRRAPHAIASTKWCGHGKRRDSPPSICTRCTDGVYMSFVARRGLRHSYMVPPLTSDPCAASSTGAIYSPRYPLRRG